MAPRCCCFRAENHYWKKTRKVFHSHSHSINSFNFVSTVCPGNSNHFTFNELLESLGLTVHRNCLSLSLRHQLSTKNVDFSDWYNWYWVLVKNTLVDLDKYYLSIVVWFQTQVIFKKKSIIKMGFWIRMFICVGNTQKQ